MRRANCRLVKRPDSAARTQPAHTSLRFLPAAALAAAALAAATLPAATASHLLPACASHALAALPTATATAHALGG